MHNRLVLIPLISMIVKIIPIFLSVLGRVAVSTSYLVIFFSLSLNFPMSTVTSRIYCCVKINPQCNWRRQPAAASQLSSLKFSWIAAFSVENRELQQAQLCRGLMLFASVHTYGFCILRFKVCFGFFSVFFWSHWTLTLWCHSCFLYGNA